MGPISPLLAHIRDRVFQETDQGQGWDTTVTIQPTSAAKSFARVPDNLPFKEFKPFPLAKIGRGLWVIVLISMGPVAAMCTTSGSAYPLLIVLCASLTWSAGIYFWSRSQDDPIYIDPHGIRIEGVLFSWGDIEETAVLTIHMEPRRWSTRRGYHVERFLVLANRYEGHSKFSLEHFFVIWGISGELSRYVEFFKKKAI